LLTSLYSWDSVFTKPFPNFLPSPLLAIWSTQMPTTISRTQTSTIKTTKPTGPPDQESRASSRSRSAPSHAVTRWGEVLWRPVGFVLILGLLWWFVTARDWVAP